MTDRIKQAIESKAINTNNVSFDIIRSISRVDYGQDTWLQLGRGRSILSSQEQLNQYLHSYGLMIKSQWNDVLESLNDVPVENVSIFDYGCGQGLASVLFFDKFRDKSRQQFPLVVLIEPSQIALERAGIICKCYCPYAQVKLINKKLDDLTKDDLKPKDGSVMVHLFSNILDVTGFNLFDLFGKIFSNKGMHYILAISHDRDHNGGSQRLRDIYNEINDEKHQKHLRIIDAGIDQYKCSNGQPAIAFFVKVER